MVGYVEFPLMSPSLIFKIKKIQTKKLSNPITIPIKKMEEHKEGYFYFASESVGEGHPDKLCD